MGVVEKAFLICVKATFFATPKERENEVFPRFLNFDDCTLQFVYVLPLFQPFDGAGL